jgi:hypothetical protein
MTIGCWLLSSNLLYSTVRTVQYQLLAGHLGGLDCTRRPYVQMYCTCESYFRVDVNVARGIQHKISIDQQKANIAPHLAIQKNGRDVSMTVHCHKYLTISHSWSSFLYLSHLFLIDF